MESRTATKDRQGHVVKKKGTYILELVDLAATIWALRNPSLPRERARKTDGWPLGLEVDAPRRSGEVAQSRSCFFRW